MVCLVRAPNRACKACRKARRGCELSSGPRATKYKTEVKGKGKTAKTAKTTMAVVIEKAPTIRVQPLRGIVSPPSPEPSRPTKRAKRDKVPAYVDIPDKSEQGAQESDEDPDADELATGARKIGQALREVMRASEGVQGADMEQARLFEELGKACRRRAAAHRQHQVAVEKLSESFFAFEDALGRADFS
jgi:hypothetical protein